MLFRTYRSIRLDKKEEVNYWNTTNNSRVPHISRGKLRVKCVTGFTNLGPLLRPVTRNALNLGLIKRRV